MGKYTAAHRIQLKHCFLCRMVSLRVLGALVLSVTGIFSGVCNTEMVSSSDGTPIGELTKIDQNPSSVQLATSCAETDFYKLTFNAMEFASHFPTPSSLALALPWYSTSTDHLASGICDANGWRLTKCDSLYNQRVALGYLYLCNPK